MQEGLVEETRNYETSAYFLSAELSQVKEKAIQRAGPNSY